MEKVCRKLGINSYLLLDIVCIQNSEFLMILDKKFHVYWINMTVGVSASEIIGSNILKFVHLDNKPDFKKYMALCFKTKNTIHFRGIGLAKEGFINRFVHLDNPKYILLISRPERGVKAHSLTNRERLISNMIETGLTSKEMAKKLSVELSTVNKHRANINKKKMKD